MGFTCGLIGLPNVGKSTLLNALSAAGAKVESYPFSTITTNIGVVDVPDERLDLLAALFPEKQKIPTQLQLLDIAGLVSGASAGEGLGNQFLAEIRTVDAILHVVRCFRDENVAHVTGELDPEGDIAIVNTELLLKDLETLQRTCAALSRQQKSGDRQIKTRFTLCQTLLETVARGSAIDIGEVDSDAEALIRELSLLTAKPVLYIANVDDNGKNEYSRRVEELGQRNGIRTITICGRIEAEIAEIAVTPLERKSYLTAWGLAESGLSQLIRASYDLLKLVTFFTIDGPEVRAWTVPQNTTAPIAAGKVHSDFANRFVQAEVMDVENLCQYKSVKTLREKGLIRRAGRDHIVQDGEIIHFICG
ncbi:redox-regulated ATPase YchF [Candidatus Acetothermia bacterium]|nr:redox-regulated ATPase YchF [Candidatus Acetothermia bacterium]